LARRLRKCEAVAGGLRQVGPGGRLTAALNLEFGGKCPSRILRVN